MAIGRTLDEITNDITGQTKASFEPSLDYVVVKIPRWAFEKFPGVEPVLGAQMKSVGEVMAIGRTFPEALNKAVQSLEIGVDALDGSGPNKPAPSAPETLDSLKIPTADRLFRVYRAIRQGLPLEEIALATGYDVWFWPNCGKWRIANYELRIARRMNSSPCCSRPSRWDSRILTLPGLSIHHSSFITHHSRYAS